MLWTWLIPWSLVVALAVLVVTTYLISKEQYGIWFAVGYFSLTLLPYAVAFAAGATMYAVAEKLDAIPPLPIFTGLITTMICTMAGRHVLHFEEWMQKRTPPAYK